VAEERPDEAEDPKTVVIRAELALAPDRAIFEADLDLDPADIVLTARRDSARELFSCRPEPGREGHPARHIAVRFRVGVDVNGRPPPVREQLGDPSVYTDTMGDESGMVRMHSGDGEHDEMDERAEACFMAACAPTRSMPSSLPSASGAGHAAAASRSCAW